MDLKSLKSKWENVRHFQNKQGYMALLISSECKPDLYIATDVDGNRCLLLFLSAAINVKIKGADKDKLVLSYLNKKAIIMIKLRDFNFIDLFNDLILSLYSKIKSISDPQMASQELIYSFYKWVDFFEDSFSPKLSNEQIKGFFGELFVLNEMLLRADFIDINSLLKSWTGPYDTSNDFVFEAKNIEVKTKGESKSHVKIASEFQLEKEFGKGLELLVITVKIDLVNGESIYDLIKKIIDLIRINIGDMTIFYKALYQKSLTVETAKTYNNHRFSVLNTKIFDCAQEGFPKLSKSDLHDEISALSYKLRVDNLAPFLLEEKKY